MFAWLIENCHAHVHYVYVRVFWIDKGFREAQTFCLNASTSFSSLRAHQAELTEVPVSSCKLLHQKIDHKEVPVSSCKLLHQKIDQIKLPNLTETSFLKESQTELNTSLVRGAMSSAGTSTTYRVLLYLLECRCHRFTIKTFQMKYLSTSRPCSAVTNLTLLTNLLKY
jgi:hypothetical protein